MRWTAILLALALSLAGCSDAGSETEEGQGMVSPGADGATDMVVEGEPDDPLEGARDPPTGWLMDDDSTLFEGSPAEEVAEEVALSSFHKAFTGGEFKVFQPATTTFDHDLVITSMDIDITIRHDSASVDPGPVFGIGGLGVGVGSTNSRGGITFLSSPGPAYGYGGHVPWNDEPLRLPKGGLVIPQGNVMGIGIGSLYVNPDDIEGVKLLMNSADYPSGLDVTSHWTVLPAVMDDEEVLSESGSFPERDQNAPGCGDDAQEGVAKFTHPVTIPDDAGQVYVEAVSAGNSDVDIYINGGDADATYPGSPEFIRLYAPNIEAMGTGTWDIEVHNCADGAMDYDLTVAVAHIVGLESTELDA